jgi:hypothetical protein
VEGRAFEVTPVYRDGSLWIAYPVAQDFGAGVVSAVRWAELDVRTWPEGITSIQDGIFGEDGIWYFDHAITVDSRHNVAFVMARATPATFTTAVYTGRLATDPLSTLRKASVLKLGETIVNAVVPQVRIRNGVPERWDRNRYGDYFGAALDPVDDSLWLLGEYPGASVAWSSWIGNLQVRR